MAQWVQAEGMLLVWDEAKEGEGATGLAKAEGSAVVGGHCRQHKRRLGSGSGDRCVVAAGGESCGPGQDCSRVSSLQPYPEALVQLTRSDAGVNALPLSRGFRQVAEKGSGGRHPFSQGLHHHWDERQASSCALLGRLPVL